MRLTAVGAAVLLMIGAAGASAQEAVGRVERLPDAPEFTAKSFRAMFEQVAGPFLADQVVTVQVCRPCVSITLQLMGVSHLAEYRRRLVVTSNTHRLELDLQLDTGGAARTNLYRLRDGRWLVLSAFDCVMLRPDPLTAQSCSVRDLPIRQVGAKPPPAEPCLKEWPARPSPRRWEPLTESVYFDDVYYVGAFDRARGENFETFRLIRGWRFASYEEEPEYLNTLGGGCEDYVEPAG